MLQPRPGRRPAQRPFRDTVRVSATGIVTAALVLAGAATGAAHANAPTLDRALIVLPAVDAGPAALPASTAALVADRRIGWNSEPDADTAAGSTGTVRISVTIADIRAPEVRLDTERVDVGDDGRVRLRAFADDDSVVAEVRVTASGRDLGAATESAPGVWVLDLLVTDLGPDARVAVVAIDESGNAASTPAHQVVPPVA